MDPDLPPALTAAPDDPSLPGRFRCPPFDDGGGVAKNVALGNYAGREVAVFDLAVVGYGQTIREHRYGTVVTRLPVPVPRLELQRVAGARRLLGRLVGVDDLDLGDPAFAAAFRVDTDVPRFAADVLTAPVREWLLTVDVPRLFLDRTDLVVPLDEPLTPSGTARWLRFAAEFLDRIPPAVWAKAAP